MSSDRLAELSAAGVAVWLDDLSRQRLSSGGLDKLRREQHVVGVTTNPTIFAKALSSAEDYADQVKDLALRDAQVGEAMRTLMTYDVRWACDVMQPAADASKGIDGRVSIEVDPGLAADTARTVAEAKALWWLVDRPNLFIKIPATREGLPAITAVLAEGISVNVTLIFSLERYEAVMNAFFAGLEQAKANGHDLSKIGSEEAKALKGKAAIANAKLAYKKYEELFSSERWQALAAAGAQPQRPLWASTSTKNPEYRDVIYVEELVAPGTVNTMPESVIHAFADHGEVRVDAVTGSYAEAQQVMDALAAVGIDYDDVVQVLEREGVEKFNISGNEMIETVKSALEAAK